MKVTYRREMRSCGKRACGTCAKGAEHGPYWYAYWREEGGRLRSRYCGKDRLLRVAFDSDDHSVPAWTPTLQLALLGRYVIHVGKRPLVCPRDISERARQVLAVLVLHSDGLTRDQVADALWPEAAPRTARGSVNTALRELDRILGGAEESEPRRSLCPRLQCHDDFVRLLLTTADGADVRELQDGPALATLSIEELATKVELYRGELLPEYRYAEWAEASRYRFSRRWHDICLHLSARLLESGRGESACVYLRRLFDADPTDEEVAILLMTGLVEQDRSSAALGVFQEVQRAMELALEAGPNGDLAALAGAIQNGRSIPSSQIQTHMRAPQVASSGSPAPSPMSLMTANCEPGESGAARLATADATVSENLSAATAFNHTGHFAQAQRAASAAAAATARTGDLAGLSESLRVQAEASLNLGAPTAALALAGASADLFEIHGDLGTVLRSRRMLAQALCAAGQFAAGFELQQSNLEAAASLNDPTQQAYILSGLGSATWPRGHLDRAATYLAEAYILARRINDAFLTLSVEYHLANICAEHVYSASLCTEPRVRSWYEESCGRFRRVMRLAEAEANPVMLLFAAVDLATLHVHATALSRARPLVKEAFGLLPSISNPTACVGWTRLADVALLVASREVGEARARLDSLLPLLEVSAPAAMAYAHRIAATLPPERDQGNAAVDHLAASLSWATRCGQMLELKQTRTRMCHAPRSS